MQENTPQANAEAILEGWWSLEKFGIYLFRWFIGWFLQTSSRWLFDNYFEYWTATFHLALHSSAEAYCTWKCWNFSMSQRRRPWQCDGWECPEFIELLHAVSDMSLRVTTSSMMKQWCEIWANLTRELWTKKWQLIQNQCESQRRISRTNCCTGTCLRFYLYLIRMLGQTVYTCPACAHFHHKWWGHHGAHPDIYIYVYIIIYNYLHIYIYLYVYIHMDIWKRPRYVSSM